jgi:hypothetical protein
MSHPIHPIIFLRFFPARWHTITGPLAHWRQITAPAVAREKAWFIRTMLPVAAAASRVWHLTKGLEGPKNGLPIPTAGFAEFAKY